MKAHRVTTNMSDGSGELVGLSFVTGRIAVRWSGGLHSHTSVYQWQADQWGGHWRHVFARGQELRAVSDARVGRVDGLRSELDVALEPAGLDLNDFRRWLRWEAGTIAGVQFDQRRASTELQALAEADGDWGAQRQERWRELEHDSTLPTRITCLAAPGSRWARVLRGWLAQLGSQLLSGADVYAHAAESGLPMSGPADLDSMVYVAVELGLAKPYDYDPQPGIGSGDTDGRLTKAEQAAWRKHQRGPWGRNRLVVGAQFWTFSRGPRYDEVRALLPPAQG